MSFPTSLADGRYLLVKPLGEGGMATVFRAFDQRLQVWRAVKILSPEYSSKPRLRARFETEAQTMALLEHRHIVRVYDVGVDGAFAYIVMELVEGGSLVDWLERHGVMPPRMAVDVTIEFCEGVAAAHAKGVIHRDIKPHNVMVTREGSCRVTDFGIARVGDGDMQITKTGAVMGTWGYMAPEQRTNAKAVDERGDVYASAATLYTLLTNKMPMDLFAADRDATMMAGIPAVLAPVLLRATDYHRENRPDTILAFAQELREVRDQLPPVPEGTPPLARDPGAPLPIPRAEDYVTRQGMTDPGTGTGKIGMQARGTIAPDDSQVRSMAVMGATLAPTDGDPVYGDTPQQDRALYTPVPSQGYRDGGSKGGGAFYWVAAVGMVGVAMVFFVVAGVIVVKGISPAPGQPSDTGVHLGDTAAIEKDTGKPGTDTAEPGKDTGRPGKDTGEPGKDTGRPGKDTADPGKDTPEPGKDTGNPGKDTGEPGTDTGKTRVEIETPRPPAKLCVQIPEPSFNNRTTAVFKANLCGSDADSADLTLNYRAADGAWQAKKLTFFAGAYTTKVVVDESYAGGLEYYVDASLDGKTASSGSMRDPHKARLP